MAGVDRTMGCLFCGNRHARFESLAHIAPKALGNSIDSGLVEQELVLPGREECDKCNGRRLARVENVLVSWPPVSIFRSLGLIPNGKGSLVDAVDLTRWDVELDQDDPRRFVMTAVGPTNATTGRDDVARALCKIAVEYRSLQDRADARSARWDHIAAAAIGGPLPPLLSIGLTLPTTPEDLDMRPEVQLQTDDGPALRLLCSVFVVGLGLDLLVGALPRWTPRTMWWKLDLATGRLDGPNTMWARLAGGAATATRFTTDPRDDEPRSRKSELSLPTGNPRRRISLSRPVGSQSDTK